jgi:hypothetical protein
MGGGCACIGSQDMHVSAGGRNFGCTFVRVQVSPPGARARALELTDTCTPTSSLAAGHAFSLSVVGYEPAGFYVTSHVSQGGLVVVVSIARNHGPSTWAGLSDQGGGKIYLWGMNGGRGGETSDLP